MNTYQEHQALPAYEAAIWVDNKPTNAPGALKWSAPFPPPPIGAAIVVTVNRCGPAIVTGYFTEDGWLGVTCNLTDPPDWFKRQNKGNPKATVFGPEMRMA